MDLHAATESVRNKPWVGYFLAAMLPVLALLVRLALGDALAGFAFLTFFPAILFVTFLGGRRAGLLSVLISALLAWYFLPEPLGSFAIASWAGAMGMALFCGVSGIIVWLVDSLERANAELRAAERGSRKYHVELERQVVDRTSALKLANEQLRASQAHSEAVANLVPDLLWGNDPGGHMTWCNERVYAYSGQSWDTIKENGWRSLVHPDDLSNTVRLLEAGLHRKEPVTIQHRLRRYDGVYRWFLIRTLPVFGDSRVVSQWFGAATDIEEIKRLEERQELLVAEVQHRTRNLLGIVQSVATQTLDLCDRPEEFGERFKKRLDALSRVQRFLSQGDRIDIGELLRAELTAHGIDLRQNRVVLDGPEVNISGSTEQAVALAIHELATNALKHGAFATPSGSLAVRWRCEPREDDDMHLVLDWHESGGVSVDALKPKRRGFGLELIERGLPYQLGATTNVSFLPEGLICTMSLPLRDGGEGRMRDDVAQALAVSVT